MNKRGAELTIGTLVIIVLAVIVLVVLVVGFTSGWGSLWANISQFFGGSGANIDTVVSACNTACLTKGVNAWCEQVRSVKADGDILASEGDGDPGKNKARSNCENLADIYANADLGLQKCPDITCPL